MRTSIKKIFNISLSISFFKSEKRKILIKALLSNFQVERVIKGKCVTFLLNRFLGFKTKINNFCVFTGRKAGVYKKFHVSRHVFKKFVNHGFIAGVKKNGF